MCSNWTGRKAACVVLLLAGALVVLIVQSGRLVAAPEPITSDSLSRSQMAVLRGSDYNYCFLVPSSKIEHNGANTTRGCDICVAQIGAFDPMCGTRQKWCADNFTWFTECINDPEKNSYEFCRYLYYDIVVSEDVCTEPRSQMDIACTNFLCTGYAFNSRCKQCAFDYALSEDWEDRWDCDGSDFGPE